jgi:hypothetical protein
LFFVFLQWVALNGPLEKNHHIFNIPQTFWAKDMGQIVMFLGAFCLTSFLK